VAAARMRHPILDEEVALVATDVISID